MESIGGDLFATKGLEYMLVIGYLLLLVGCRRMVGPRRSRSVEGEPAFPSLDALRFHLREGRHYHQGHTWATPAGDGLVRVGVDDFAQRLLGPVTGVILPRIGALLDEGEPGWKVRVGRQSIPVLSPIEGEVVAWNEEVLRAPSLVNTEPYDGGWLLEVRARNPSVAGRNLLSGNLAHAWMEDSAARIENLFRTRPEAVTVESASSDVGLARMLSPDGGDRLARELLLSEDQADWSPYGGAVKQDARQDQDVQLV
jgi:glycine cleavage system H lipoate-binding protein